jgi:hypothetical protein
MAAIDLTPLTTLIQDQAKESLKLVDNLKSLRTQYLDRAAILFGVAGTADGNDAVSMWSGCLHSDKLIDNILLSQTDAELQVSWEIVVGVPVVTITADLTALAVAIKDALTLIEANESVFLLPELDRTIDALGYPTLTSGQRSAANAKFTAISALLVT